MRREGIEPSIVLGPQPTYNIENSYKQGGRHEHHFRGCVCQFHHLRIIWSGRGSNLHLGDQPKFCQLKLPDHVVSVARTFPLLSFLSDSFFGRHNLLGGGRVATPCCALSLVIENWISTYLQTGVAAHKAAPPIMPMCRTPIR